MFLASHTSVLPFSSRWLLVGGCTPALNYSVWVAMSKKKRRKYFYGAFLIHHNCTISKSQITKDGIFCRAVWNALARQNACGEQSHPPRIQIQPAVQSGRPCCWHFPTVRGMMVRNCHLFFNRQFFHFYVLAFNRSKANILSFCPSVMPVFFFHQCELHTTVPTIAFLDCFQVC